MGLQRRSEAKWNSPAVPDPVPLASDASADALTQCPACEVAVRPGAVLCVSCGARIGRIETVVSVIQATREPCPNCGYDLSGIEGATCPECGGNAPFVAVKLDIMTEKEEWLRGQILWEAYRRPLGASVFGLLALVTLAGLWYGVPGVKFWLATVIPAWLLASVGYFIAGAMIRFLDTTVLIGLAQVFGVTVVGLAATQLVFPYNAGTFYISPWTMFFVPALVAGVTMLVMEDDDRVNCFLVSLPITIACVVVPLILLLIVA